MTPEPQLPIARDPYATKTLQDRLSGALLEERDIPGVLAEINPALYSDTRNELHTLKKQYKDTAITERERLDVRIENIKYFVIDITEERIDKILQLARDRAVDREKLDIGGMMEEEMIAYNKITDALLVLLDQLYQKAGVTDA